MFAGALFYFILFFFYSRFHYISLDLCIQFLVACGSRRATPRQDRRFPQTLRPSLAPSWAPFPEGGGRPDSRFVDILNPTMISGKKTQEVEKQNPGAGWDLRTPI